MQHEASSLKTGQDLRYLLLFVYVDLGHVSSVFRSENDRNKGYNKLARHPSRPARPHPFDGVQAVCALTPCPGGTTSVVVGEAEPEARRLMKAKAAAEPRRSLRRRLNDLDAVAFAVPTEGSGVEAGEGDLTGLRFATTMMNQIADPVRPAELPRVRRLRSR